jgi:phage-related protein
MDREERFVQDLEGGIGMGGALDMDDAVSAVSSNSALSCANSALSTGKLSALSGLSRANSAKSVRPPPTVIRLMRSERLGFLARGSIG